jgi:two-component system sensor histidine kinase KdpD
VRRGRHKIFIGMAPGVGKTYKMLEEGHSLRKQGTDVVIGLLETHGRKETAEKAEGSGRQDHWGGGAGENTRSNFGGS